MEETKTEPSPDLPAITAFAAFYGYDGPRAMAAWGQRNLAMEDERARFRAVADAAVMASGAPDRNLLLADLAAAASHRDYLAAALARIEAGAGDREAAVIAAEALAAGANRASKPRALDVSFTAEVMGERDEARDELNDLHARHQAGMEMLSEAQEARDKHRGRVAELLGDVPAESRPGWAPEYLMDGDTDSCEPTLMTAPTPERDDPFGGHEFAYEPHTDLFRCVRCHRYEVSARKEGGGVEPCGGSAPDGSGPIEVNAW